MRRAGPPGSCSRIADAAIVEDDQLSAKLIVRAVSKSRWEVAASEQPIERFEDMPAEVQQASKSLTQYALAMQGAQFLEFKLAILWNLIETDLTPRRPKNIEKAFRPIARRVRHAFQKASASELRKNLEGKVDNDLLEQVSELITVRDRLAHRYLRDQFVLPAPVYGQRMYDEMEELIGAFNAVNALIDEETERVRSAKSIGSDELLPGTEELTRTLMYDDLD